MENPPLLPADPARTSLDPPAPGGRWAMPLVLFTALAIMTGLMLKFKPPAAIPPAGADRGAVVGWAPAPPDGPAVSLSIDFGNGARRDFSRLPWNEGMTVGSLMEAAAQFRPGIRLERRGEGAMTLLTSIDGVANQGPGGRSWIYSVNGQAGEVSCAVQPLATGDRVLWVFSAPE
ncbi:MAG: DUF4430 domain-containing protein [Pirellulales bacterium]|nr:DUF4430 domain-containing protein [Pirellulales bacterium]